MVFLTEFGKYFEEKWKNMVFYIVSFLNAARFARGRGFGLFLTERVPYQELPQNTQNATKKAGKMGREAPHFIDETFRCSILCYFALFRVTLGTYFFGQNSYS